VLDTRASAHAISDQAELLIACRMVHLQIDVATSRRGPNSARFRAVSGIMGYCKIVAFRTNCFSSTPSKRQILRRKSSLPLGYERKGHIRSGPRRVPNSENRSPEPAVHRPPPPQSQCRGQ
jgi:hypothetical protein